MYLDHLRLGHVIPNSTTKRVRDDGPILAFDARNGFGRPAAETMMRAAIGRCRKHGVCAASLGNSHHLGRLGAFGELAAEAGLISIHFANVTGMRPLVAPFGGIEPRLSTNPICLAAPGPGDLPVVLFDASTSAIAMNKVRVALQSGLPLPAGTVIDAHGCPAVDPSVMFNEPSGALLPTGLHKGYGLAVMCELLAGTLSGAGAMPATTRKGRGLTNNLLSLLLDPRRWVASETLLEEVERLIAYLHETTPIDIGHPVQLPGEWERNARSQNATLGVPIPEDTLDALTRLAGAHAPAAAEVRL
jgi:LDH2 family malate/lactate/ureidoglycolate dehydrogenase